MHSQHILVRQNAASAISQHCPGAIADQRCNSGSQCHCQLTSQCKVNDMWHHSHNLTHSSEVGSMRIRGTALHVCIRNSMYHTSLCTPPCWCCGGHADWRAEQVRESHRCSLKAPKPVNTPHAITYRGRVTSNHSDNATPEMATSQSRKRTCQADMPCLHSRVSHSKYEGRDCEGVCTPEGQEKNLQGLVLGHNYPFLPRNKTMQAVCVDTVAPHVQQRATLAAAIAVRHNHSMKLDEPISFQKSYALHNQPSCSERLLLHSGGSVQTRPRYHGMQRSCLSYGKQVANTP